MIQDNINDAGIKRIAIVGGGVTGWTVAAALAKGLRGLGINIVLIDTPGQSQVDLQCEAVTPTCIAFHQWLGLDEKDLLTTTGASFLLATQFNAWSDQQQHYFMPFSDHGFMLNRIEFPQYAIDRHLQGHSSNYDDYALAAVAARLGRFCHPSAQGASLLSTLNYGLTLNTHTYTNYLRAFARQLNVEHIIAGQSALQLGHDGYIESINLQDISNHTQFSALQNEGVVTADFYIDCTGAQGTLIEKALHVEWQTLSQQLPLTHIVSHARPIPPTQALPSQRELLTGTAGWIQKLYSQTHTEQQYFYHTDFTSPEQACLSIGAEENVHIKALSTGRRASFWHKNCLAIGEAAGNLSVLSAGNVYLVQSAILRFLNLFPTQITAGFNTAEFNRLTHLEYDHLEDFHILHYHLAANRGTAYWQQIATTSRSDRLLHRLELFKKRGLIPAYEGEIFSAGVWTSLLLGNGFWPERANPLIRSMDSNWIVQQLEKMKTLMYTAAEAMPAQSIYLSQQNLRHY